MFCFDTERPILMLVPEHDAEAFQEAFQRVGESIRLTEVR
jgi:hypothetical protein